MTQVVRLMIDHTPSPIGLLAVVADHEGRLRGIDWSPGETGLHQWLSRQHGEDGYALEPSRDPGGLTSSLIAYFEGDLGVIDRLSIETGGTPFQRSVWSALREIPCGQTISYGELALRIGRPSAVRAVGLANGTNPIPVVIPCHRVIGADGTLTGYGGGLDRKRWLLAHEGAMRAEPMLPLALEA